MYIVYTNAYMCIVSIIHVLYMHAHKVYVYIYMYVCMYGRMDALIQIVISAKEKSKMEIGLKFYIKWAGNASLR